MEGTTADARSAIDVARAAEDATLWNEAARGYEEALSHVSEGREFANADEAAFLTRLGACYWNMSGARAAWRTLRREMSLYQQRGDGIGLAKATLEILRIFGPPERQRQMAEDALASLGEADPHPRAQLLLR